MSWEQFIYFAMAAILLWAIGAWAAWKEKTGIAYTATIVGLVVFFSFILSMWIILERPPLRTMGETRLWFCLYGNHRRTGRFLLVYSLHVDFPGASAASHNG